ncbi:MAG: aminotransferase class I/II-fold pyridoxal phosphate-dependent enzyme [Dermatophilus congolensis]|nr:aminotransferase class I/II-fold pyridoxal phosphate-dependent enzyme [Dermatophilus congolensis]
MSDPLVERMRPFGSTIFGRISGLAAQVGAVNLGQGFPDEDGPREVLEAASAALFDGRNQYPPPNGTPLLREAIARHRGTHFGIEVDPADVLVTHGATEGIASCLLGLCEAGDEVVTFEPYFDSYAAIIALAGATRRTSVLRFPDYAVDEASLRAAFGPRTRAILLNSPHNPTGKVFTREELELIRDLAVEYDAWIITDEVYEHLVFDGATHIPIASLPGAAERTLSIGSAGKTFSVTGWKVGWVTGPAEGVAAAAAVKQFLTYAGGAPFQPAVATGLDLPGEYFAHVARALQAKRDLFVGALRLVDIPLSEPQGTFFVTADLAPLGVTDAAAFCFEMPERFGLAAIPVSVFHDDPEVARSIVRFAFCKRNETLFEGVTRLDAMVNTLRTT